MISKIYILKLSFIIMNFSQSSEEIQMEHTLENNVDQNKIVKKKLYL